MLSLAINCFHVYMLLIETLERQTNIIYNKDEKVVDTALRNANFSDLDEIWKAYELESRNPRITIRRNRCLSAGKAADATIRFTYFRIVIVIAE